MIDWIEEERNGRKEWRIKRGKEKEELKEVALGDVFFVLRESEVGEEMFCPFFAKFITKITSTNFAQSFFVFLFGHLFHHSPKMRFSLPLQPMSSLCVIFQSEQHIPLVYSTLRFVFVIFFLVPNFLLFFILFSLNE